MQVHVLPCPHCEMPLRVRDRAFIGRPFPCPECGGSLQILEDSAGRLSGEAIQENSVPRPSGPTVTWTERMTGVLTPTIVAWTVAAVMTSLLIGLLWHGRSPPVLPASGSPPDVADADAVESSASVRHDDGGADVVPEDQQPPPEVVRQPSPARIVEDALDEAPVRPRDAGDVELPPQPAPHLAAADDFDGDLPGLVEQIARGEDVPILVPMAEEPSRVDVEAALAQPIARFAQEQPVPFRDLLRMIEEMAGVPVSTASLTPDRLEQFDTPVTLIQSETTVGAILQELAGRLGLACERDANGLRLVEGGSSQTRAASVGVEASSESAPLDSATEP